MVGVGKGEWEVGTGCGAGGDGNELVDVAYDGYVFSYLV